MNREKKINNELLLNFIMIFLATLFLAGAAVYFYVVGGNYIVTISLAATGLLYCILGYVLYRKTRYRVFDLLNVVGYEQSQVLKHLLIELPVPYLMTDEKGEIIWANKPFYKLAGPKKMKKNISQFLDGAIQKKTFPQGDQVREYHINVGEEYYRVEGRRVSFDDAVRADKSNRPDGAVLLEESMFIFIFHDESTAVAYKKELDNKNLVAGLIYVDNLEEVLETMEEVRQSLLIAVVDRKIYRYLQKYKAIVKKFERDRFLFVFEQKYLEEMAEDKFDLMDDVRTISMGNTITTTLSIGIGLNAPDYMSAYENARAAIDLALGRGGDQTVVKDGESISYYGGNTQKVEKTTRVKARVKAHALRELMMTNGRVFIMGHKMPDADSIGAALGIYRLAKTIQKEAYIVMDEEAPAISMIIDEVKRAAADKETVFITGEQAALLKEPSSMIVIVDVNMPEMTLYPPLLKSVNAIVVFDHHRQTKDTIKNAALSYIEPYASSTSELVAEILQYIVDKPKLLPIEADALYSGILVDTDNFVIRAGVRTFEAAAYLRRAGADVTRVRKMFRDDMINSKMRAQVISNAEIYLGEFAVATFNPADPAGATVVGAKAANELLDIQGVRGSFVLTRLPEYIYISARSIDDLNVHSIMERMGGGGHLTVAATQIKDKSLYEVERDLKTLLTEMKENKEI